MDKPVIIVLCVIGSVLLICGLTLLFIFLKKKKNVTNYNETIEKIILNLGGNDNINDVVVKMSRAEFSLKDYELVNKEELKNLGVQGISKTSKKITLVVGNELANDLDKAFKKN